MFVYNVNLYLLMYEQALKTGQLPADLKIPDYDTGAKDVPEEDEKMIDSDQDKADREQKNVEEQKDESGPMEQVTNYSNRIASTFKILVFSLRLFGLS